MKSILQESSTIIKAIEKAWSEAGKPEEFTIKIVQKEERNFLGICKKQAIVSFQYGTKVIARKQQQKTRWQVSKHQHESHKETQSNSSNAGDDRSKQTNQRNHTTQESQKSSTQSYLPHDMSEWSEELKGIIDSWLSEALAIMNVRVAYTIKSDQKTLTIVFKDGIVNTSDEERMLFSSFSSLFMQALKKKYRNRFKGFKIILHSPLSGKSSVTPHGKET